MTGLVATLAVNRDAMAAAAREGFITATAIADALVRRGVAFRVAHHVVGSLVAEAEHRGGQLDDLPDAPILAALAAAEDELARGLAAEPGAADLIRGAASIEGALAGADVIGGTAPRRVAAELRRAAARVRAADGR
jgi:argininosuccinate lyase